MVAAIGAASLAAPPWPRAGVALAAGVCTLTVVLGCAAWLPWSRLPPHVQVVPPLAFYLALSFLRHSAGGSSSGLAPLAVLPVLWLGLYGSRRQTISAVMACGTMFLAPVILIGAPDYPLDDWRRAALWTAVAALLGSAVQQLVRSGERHSARMDALLGLSRRQIGTDPAATRMQACAVATDIVGARFAVLMEPDGAGNLVSTSISGVDLRRVVIPLAGPVSGSAIAFNANRRLFVPDTTDSALVSQDMVAATRAGSMLFEPVRQDGQILGVLGLGFSEQQTTPHPDDIAIVELITQQLASLTTRDDLLARLTALAADASDMVGRYDLTDRGFRVSYCSPSTYTMLGRRPESMVGTAPTDIVHDDDKATLSSIRADLLAGRTATTGPYRAAHADGHWVWLETTVRPIVDGVTGRVTEVQATSRDVGDRVRIKADLLHANTLFAGVLAAATEYSIIGTDPDGLITVFNVGAERMLGYTAEEMVNQAFPAILHDPAEVAARAAALGVEPGFEAFVALARQGRADSQEWTYLAKGGRRIHVLLTVTEMREHDGRLSGFIGIAHDLADHDNALRQVGEAYQRELAMVEQLKNLARARDDFVSAVTHDLRSPLTSIRGYAEILLESNTIAGPQHRMLETIDRNAQRLLKLVDDLLTTARMEAGKLRLVLAPIDFAAFLHDVCHGFEPEAARRHITFTTHADVSVGFVLIDAHQIERVLSNLLSNAMKFTPDGGRVALDAVRISEDVVVTIVDTGVGIPQAELDDLFTAFSRASTATDRHIPGTGLGLTITKAIVEQHGGTIELTSKLEAGTTATIRLHNPTVHRQNVPTGPCPVVADL